MNSPQKPYCAYLATKTCLRAPENIISSEERYIGKVTQIFFFFFGRELWKYFFKVFMELLYKCQKNKESDMEILSKCKVQQS